jgi:hypothetical protein
MGLIWIGLAAKGLSKQSCQLNEHKNSILTLVHLFSLIFFVFALLHFSYFTDIVFSVNEIQVRQSPLNETMFHQGLANSLKWNYPPPSIYASGESDFSSYHLAMHSSIELVHRFFSIDTVLLTYFFIPFLYFFLITATAYSFFRQRCENWEVGLLVALCVFGTNLAFVPGVLEWGYSSYPWEFLLPGTIWSLFTLNGYTPSILVLFMAFVFLWDYFETRSRQPIALFTLLTFVALYYKSSMGFHMLGSTCLLGVLLLSHKKLRQQGSTLLLSSLVVLAAIIVEIYLMRGGIGSTLVQFAPFNQFKLSLTKMQIYNLNIFTYPVIFSLYLVGVFSCKLFGFAQLRRGVSRQNASIIYLALFCICGFWVAEFFYLGQEGDKINNSSWFASEALIGGWLLLGTYLVYLKNNGHLKRYILLISLTIILALPGTIEFLYKRYADDYFVFNNEALEVVDYLEKLPPDIIILYPPELKGPSLSSNFAGKQSVLSPYMSFLPNSARANERLKVGTAFFQAETPMAFKRFIINHYGIDTIYAPLHYREVLNKVPFLQTSFVNDSYVIYTVKAM